MRKSTALLLAACVLIPFAQAQNTLAGNLTVQQTVKLTGAASPAQITANVNDYDPTGFSTAAVLRLQSDVPRTITGLAGGAAGRMVWLTNVGAQTITLATESASSTAANRFAFGSSSFDLIAGGGLSIWYDTTSSRWRAATNLAAGSGGGTIDQTARDAAAAAQATADSKQDALGNAATLAKVTEAAGLPLWDGAAWPGGGGGGTGTVTSVSVVSANGVSGSVATATTTPAITLSLGSISPSSVAASGTVTGSNLSGTNTGDQTSVTGNAGTATALATARAINGVSFDGTAAITVPAAAGTLTGSTLASGVTASSLTSAAGGSFGTAAFTAATAYDPAGSAAAITLAGLGGVPTSRTVNGHALSSNVTVTAADAGAEVALGNPVSNGYVLSSTTGGTRSWVAQTVAPAGANPSATVGLTAVNGSAATFLRSDASPALNQSVSPTWSGTHTFSNTVSARALAVTGTAGAGFITLPAQSSNPTAPAAGTLLIHASTANGITRMEQDNEMATNLVYGRDNVFVARNKTGSTITKGSVVYTSGVVGVTPEISLARANAGTTLPALGVSIDNIAHNSFGQVMVLGIVTMNTTAFSDGNPVWVSPTTSGAMTATRPSGTSNYVQRVGTVLVSGVNGTLLVDIAPAVLNSETGTNAATWTGKALAGDSLTLVTPLADTYVASAAAWNAKVSFPGFGTTGTTAAVGNDARLSDARTPLAHNQAWSTITSTPTTLSGYGITDAQGLDSDLTALASNATNGLWARTGAGTGSVRTITGTANQVTVTNGDGVSGNPTLSLPQSIATASTPQFALLGVGVAAAAGNTIIANNTDSNRVLFAGITKGIRFTHNSTGSVVEGVDSTGSASYQPLYLGGSYVAASVSGTEKMRLDGTGLGIGTTSPATLLQVGSSSGVWNGGAGRVGVVAGPNAAGGILSVVSTTALAADNGGSVSFGGFYDSNVVDFAGVIGAKENATSSNTAGYLRLRTRPHAGNMTDQVGISSVGALRLFAYGAGALTTDSSGNVTASSDRRLKNVSGRFTRGLDAIIQIQPKVYTWKPESGMNTEDVNVGFIAQDVQDAIPEAVGTMKTSDTEEDDGTGKKVRKSKREASEYLTLSDRPIIAALVNAVKELKAENDDLRARVSALEGKAAK